MASTLPFFFSSIQVFRVITHVLFEENKFLLFLREFCNAETVAIFHIRWNVKDIIAFFHDPRLSRSSFRNGVPDNCLNNSLDSIKKL